LVLSVAVLILSAPFAVAARPAGAAQTPAASSLPVEHYPKLIGNCSTPNPGGYGYIWPVAGVFDSSDRLIYISVAGVVGGGGFPSAGNVTVIAPPCKVVANVRLPFNADPGALAYDPSTRQVWVTDYDFPTVYVIQGTAIVTTLTNPGWCGTASAIAYDPATKAMMIANCDNTVSVFSGGHLSHVFTTGLSLYESPSAILVTPNDEIFVANWGGNDVAILNGSTYHWLREVDAGNLPECLAWDSFDHEVIVSHVGEIGHDYLVAIDPLTNTVVTQLPVLSSGGEWALGYSVSTRLILTADASGDVFATNPAGVSHQVYLHGNFGVDWFTYDPITGDTYALDVYSTVYVLS